MSFWRGVLGGVELLYLFRLYVGVARYILCKFGEKKNLKFVALRLSEFSRHYVMHVGWYCFI